MAIYSRGMAHLATLCKPTLQRERESTNFLYFTRAEYFLPAEKKTTGMKERDKVEKVCCHLPFFCSSNFFVQNKKYVALGQWQRHFPDKHMLHKTECTYGGDSLEDIVCSGRTVPQHLVVLITMLARRFFWPTATYPTCDFIMYS